MDGPKVLVTGASGYIGRAVAEAFRRAGWATYGLLRRPEAAPDLARSEIRPVIGSPDDLSFLEGLGGVAFDVVVSNTEDAADPRGHFEKVRALLDAAAQSGGAGGRRPLAMFTSGCKDYGPMAARDGDPGLAPHTEESPLAPPEPLRPRMEFGRSLLAAAHPRYDATVLRPTIVYGGSSSYYGLLFDRAERSRGRLVFAADPGAIMHSVDVQDCAAAYVALAEHPDRGAVAGHAFNIANARYETAGEIGAALARSYGLTLEFGPPVAGASLKGVDSLTNFSQWVSSRSLRQLTGWRERKPPFAAGLEEYRLAYEANKPPAA